MPTTDVRSHAARKLPCQRTPTNSTSLRSFSPAALKTKTAAYLLGLLPLLSTQLLYVLPFYWLLVCNPARTMQSESDYIFQPTTNPIRITSIRGREPRGTSFSPPLLLIWAQVGLLIDMGTGRTPPLVLPPPPLLLIWAQVGLLVLI